MFLFTVNMIVYVESAKELSKKKKDGGIKTNQ
jgi:hypothetical protein